MKSSEAFPQANEPSDRSIDVELVESLTASTEVVTPEELNELLSSHSEFLQSGGAGGTWTLLSVSALTLCIYQGARGDSGEQATFRLKNLEGVDASKVLLEFADISGTFAPNINFSGAKLSGSVMVDSVFEGANFESAVLRNVDFSGARLAGANFQNADLRGADFEGADLRGADFTGATMDGSRFPGAILEDAIGPTG